MFLLISQTGSEMSSCWHNHYQIRRRMIRKPMHKENSVKWNSFYGRLVYYLLKNMQN